MIAGSDIISSAVTIGAAESIPLPEKIRLTKISGTSHDISVLQRKGATSRCCASKSHSGRHEVLVATGSSAAYLIIQIKRHDLTGLSITSQLVSLGYKVTITVRGSAAEFIAVGKVFQLTDISPNQLRKRKKERHE
ncbi:hypothetical protein EBT16_10785 [bacterium]|nr:hypothetical protein [bacterium]